MHGLNFIVLLTMKSYDTSLSMLKTDISHIQLPFINDVILPQGFQTYSGQKNIYKKGNYLFHFSLQYLHYLDKSIPVFFNKVKTKISPSSSVAVNWKIDINRY